MGDKAQNYVPPNAALCWVDERYVYVAIPMGLEQYIQTFPLTEGGLSKALGILKARHVSATKQGYVLTPINTRIVVQRTKAKPKEPVGSSTQQSAALEILRKRGMLR